MSMVVGLSEVRRAAGVQRIGLRRREASPRLSTQMHLQFPDRSACIVKTRIFCHFISTKTVLVTTLLGTALAPRKSARLTLVHQITSYTKRRNVLQPRWNHPAFGNKAIASGPKCVGIDLKQASNVSLLLHLLSPFPLLLLVSQSPLLFSTGCVQFCFRLPA